MIVIGTRWRPRLFFFLSGSLLLLTGLITYSYFEERVKMRTATFKPKIQGEYEPRPICVLILAYARSGSSFLGELLAAGPDAFYLFEPSHEILLSRNISDVDTTAGILEGLFNCRNSSLQILSGQRKGNKSIGFYLHKFNGENRDISGECLSANVRILKTIRYNLVTAKRLADEYPSLNVKIVHLVRDPRAIINSLIGHQSWAKTNRSAALRCHYIRNDLRFGPRMPSEQYVRIRYEDLIGAVLENSAKLYGFLGVPLHDRLAVFIADHTKADVAVKKPDLRYFSTYRKDGFDPNHWRRSLNRRQIRDIEYFCGDIIDELGYQRMFS